MARLMRRTAELGRGWVVRAGLEGAWEPWSRRGLSGTVRRRTSWSGAEQEGFTAEFDEGGSSEVQRRLGASCGTRVDGGAGREGRQLGSGEGSSGRVEDEGGAVVRFRAELAGGRRELRGRRLRLLLAKIKEDGRRRRRQRSSRGGVPRDASLGVVEFSSPFGRLHLWLSRFSPLFLPHRRSSLLLLGFCAEKIEPRASPL